jgi:hypothetical protein
MILSLMNYTFDLLIYDPRFLPPKHKFKRIDNMGKKIKYLFFPEISEPIESKFGWNIPSNGTLK